MLKPACFVDHNIGDGKRPSGGDGQGRRSLPFMYNPCTSASACTTITGEHDEDDANGEKQFAQALYDEMEFKQCMSKTEPYLFRLDAHYTSVSTTLPPAPTLQQTAAQFKRNYGQMTRSLRNQTMFLGLPAKTPVRVASLVNLGNGYQFYFARGRVVGEPHSDGSYTVEVLRNTPNGKAWTTVSHSIPRHDLIQEKFWNAARRTYRQRCAALAHLDGE